MKSGFRKFMVIWAGELLSVVGIGMTAFALGVYMFQRTGMATPGALVVFFSFLPAFLVRPLWRSPG